MHKILYIEDEAFLAKIVKESLERLGYEVVHLSDGRTMSTYMKEFEPDICVFDIMLPYKNGYDLAKELKSKGYKTPIIFLTAKSQTKDLVAGFEAGGNDYIKKPFSMEELQLRIENLMKITQGSTAIKASSEVFELGSSLTFYPKKQQLVSKDKTISLSHKENQILLLLSKHKNETTDRKEILLKVWNDDSYFNSRNLDVYIRKLRSYLSPHENLKILTLKGIGYHFVVE